VFEVVRVNRFTHICMYDMFLYMCVSTGFCIYVYMGTNMVCLYVLVHAVGHGRLYT